MNYIEFTDYIRTAVDEAVVGDHRVEIKKVVKNNNCERMAVVISREGKCVAPTIYLEEFYDKYRMGISLDIIINEIIEIDINNSDKLDIDVAQIMNFESMRERIRCRIVNYESNSTVLNDVPYRTEMDLAIEYYININDNGFEAMTTLIHNRCMEHWGINEDELFEIAWNNTVRDGTLIIPIEQLVLNEDLDINSKMYVVTNQRKLYGAIHGFLPDTIEKLEEMFGDFYILPSSVHEVIVLAADVVEDEEYIVNMVKDVNETQLTCEEILSNNVYKYEKSGKSLHMVNKIKFATQ